MAKAFLAAGLLVMAMALPAAAGPAPAVAWDLGYLMERAAAGDPVAGFDLAMGLMGRGPGGPAAPRIVHAAERQMADGLRLLRAAAEAGHPEAQYQMGLSLDAGLPALAPDKRQAYEWYARAAERGHARAMVAQADRLSGGLGVPPDPEAAAGLYKAAAEAGLPEAQLAYGQILRQGRGLDKDPAEAAAWLRRAAQLGLAPAQRQLGQMIMAGEGLRRDPVEANAWLAKAANGGDAEAQLSLGLNYLSGLGVKADQATAVAWLERSAAQGEARAESLLATLR